MSVHMQEVDMQAVNPPASQSEVIISALKSENSSLKSVIDALSAEKQALEQTVMEILRANVSLRSTNIIIDKRGTDALKKSSELEKLLESALGDSLAKSVSVNHVPDSKL